MNAAEITKTLYMSVFKVVRGSVTSLSRPQFLKKKFSELFADASPTGWPSFWAEVATETIRQDFARRGIGISEFSAQWFDDDKPMVELRNHIKDKQFPIN